MIWDTNLRLRRIERLLGILDDVTVEDLIKADASIRMEVTVVPQWDRIIEIMWAGAGGQEAFERKVPGFLKEREAGPSLSDPGKPIWRGYNFIYFHDALSGLEIIWSSDHKAFGKRMCVHDGGLEIAPWGITERDEVGRELVRVPFWDIVRLLTDIGKRMAACEKHAIKRFPDKLRDELATAGVNYDPGYLDAEKEDEDFNRTEWAQANGVRLYDEEIDSHLFETKHLKVFIDLDVVDNRKLPV